MNEYLRRYALTNSQSGSAQTYVVTRQGEVVGYYSLSPGHVSRDEVPERVRKGLGRYSIGVILLARLAVDKREQGKRLGEALLKDALLRAEAAADIISGRAVLVHAIDAAARGFYERYDFEPSPINEHQLFLLMKDLRNMLRRQ